MTNLTVATPGEATREFYREQGRREVRKDLQDRLLKTIWYYANELNMNVVQVTSLCSRLEDEFDEIFSEGK